MSKKLVVTIETPENVQPLFDSLREMSSKLGMVSPEDPYNVHLHMDLRCIDPDVIAGIYVAYAKEQEMIKIAKGL